MRLLLLSLIFAFEAFGQNTCLNSNKLEIAYLNGVWSAGRDNIDSLDSIKNIVINNENIYNGSPEDICFNHISNTNNGYLLDLYEVYYQKLLEVYSVDAATNFLQELFFSPNTTMTETAAELYSQSFATFIVNQETSDLSLALSELDNSFQEGRAVVLVSHSQGNLFANRLYDTYFAQADKKRS